MTPLSSFPKHFDLIFEAYFSFNDHLEGALYV
jgi:hypothetical protein